MFVEYWQNTETINDKFIGGWLITKDMGTLGDDNYIGFVGYINSFPLTTTGKVMRRTLCEWQTEGKA